MAILTVNTLSRTGLKIEDVAVAASGGGDSFPNTGAQIVALKNASGSTITVSFAIQVENDGVSSPARTVSVPAGKTVLTSRWPVAAYNDSNGRVQITYSSVTSLTIAIFQDSSY